MAKPYINLNTQIDDTGISLGELVKSIQDLSNGTGIKLKGNLNKIDIFSDSNRFYNGDEHHTEYCNEMIHNGVYYWGPEYANRPGSLYGTMIVVNSAGIEYNKINNWCNQLAFGTDGVIWFRQSINTGPFGNWVRVI